MRPGIVIVALWLGWLISWLLAALWSNQTEKRPAIGTEIRYRIPIFFGMPLMFVSAHGYEGMLRLWHIGLCRLPQTSADADTVWTEK